MSEKDYRMILQSQAAIMMALKEVIEARYSPNMWRNLITAPLDKCIQQNASRTSAIYRKARFKTHVKIKQRQLKEKEGKR